MQPKGGGSEKKKAKKSVLHRSQESKKEFKGKHVLESLHKPGIRLILHVTVVLYCSLGSHLTPTPHIDKLVYGAVRGI